MRDRYPHTQARAGAALPILLATALTLAGCGAGGFAPEGPASNAFLDRVQTSCGKLSVGDQPIGWLLGTSNTDTGFIDATTKLYAGEFSQSDYTSYINSFYPTGRNQPALDCIFGLL